MKSTIISILVAVALIGGVFYITKSKDSGVASVANVSVSDGKQIVELGAKDGYAPVLTAAKANMPTILRVKTSGTFDCSSAITIPSIGYRTFLPQTGTTDIEIPPQTAGTSMKIVCAMGMRNAAVNFN